MAPKSNTLISELQGMPIAINSEIVVKVKAGGLGVGKKFDDCAIRVFGNRKRFVKRLILLTVIFGNGRGFFRALRSRIRRRSRCYELPPPPRIAGLRFSCCSIRRRLGDRCRGGS